MNLFASITLLLYSSFNYNRGLNLLKFDKISFYKVSLLDLVRKLHPIHREPPSLTCSDTDCGQRECILLKDMKVDLMLPMSHPPTDMFVCFETTLPYLNGSFLNLT